MNRPAPVEASDIPEGGYFTKRQGAMVYIRISDSSRSFHGLKAGHVYGVCHNGNVTCIEADKLVRPSSSDKFHENVQDDIDWHDGIGAHLPDCRTLDNGDCSNASCPWAK